MRSYTTPRTEPALPAISNCWKRKDCDGAPGEFPLERVAPKSSDRKPEPSSRPLFGNNPFESFENAFQSISF